MSELLPPRKVLMTADTVSGVWAYALELACGLAEHGIEVALATMGAPLDEQQRHLIARIPRLKLFESPYKLEWMEDAWRDVERAGEWLMALEERFSPDLVHLNGYAHAALPWSCPKVVAGHACALSWWEAVKDEPAPESLDRYREEARAGLAAADLVVAPSAARMASLIRHYGPLPHTRVILNGLNGRDGGHLRPSAKEPILFSSGRLWDEAMNLESLETVAPHLPWPIFVAGESHPPEAGEARPHHTRLLGRLSQRVLTAWLGRSSIYVLPARYEPFGLSVLEAALAGCALVLSDIPSLRELWHNRAVFVPADDPEALEDALLRLIEDPDRRNVLAAGAHSRAAERGAQRMVSEYLEAYSEVLTAGANDGGDLDGLDDLDVDVPYLPQQIAV